MKTKEFKKLIRFTILYGLRRAAFKAAGRLRIGHSRFFALNIISNKKNVAVIGCGQFSFATIGAILEIYGRNSYKRAFDIDKKNQNSLEKFYGLRDNTLSTDQIFQDNEVDAIYIASNHSTHAQYAIQGIRANKIVYIEKPICVSWSQLSQLSYEIANATNSIYFGYNRPFSRAIIDLKSYCCNLDGPITLNFFVIGHLIPEDHWYRNPNEGTRVCGNMGHWIDLAVHILSWQTLEDRWLITIVSSDPNVSDDNCSVTLTSPRGDLISLTLTARAEPYEGINESINIQWDVVIAKIDDFRKIQIWKSDKYIKHTYWPKDVGHKLAILQPFSKPQNRWQEVRKSTLLMLKITDMIRNGISSCVFSFIDEAQKHNIN